MGIKYFVVTISSLLLEIGSTMYISSVAEKQILGAIFWSFLAPFIALPFSGLVADSNWKQRLYLAFFSAFGYCLGSFISMEFIISN